MPISSAGMDLGNTQPWTRKQTFPATSTTEASINLPHGTAPSGPTNGDLWTTSAGGLFARINSSTLTVGMLESANTWTGQQYFSTSPIKHGFGIISEGNGNGSTTGNARGTGAIDLQTLRTSATQVASANYTSILGGQRCTASGLYAVVGGYNGLGSAQGVVAIGEGPSASQPNAVAIGSATSSGRGSVSIGRSVTAGGTSTLSTVAIGDGASTSGSAGEAISIGDSLTGGYGKVITIGYGNGSAINSNGTVALGFDVAPKWGNYFAVNVMNDSTGQSPAQFGWLQARRTTTNSTPVVVELGSNSSTYINLTADCTYYFEAYAMARSTTTDVNAAWCVRGAITRPASGNCSIVGTNTTESYKDGGASSWNFTVTADTTNQRAQLNATGDASLSVNFNIVIFIVICYGG